MKYVRRPVLMALALALATLGLSPRVGAWTDARPAGLVTEVAVDRDGGATVTLRIRWRILAGRLHQFDLADLPPDLSILEASALTATGAPVPLSTRSPAPGRLEVNLGDEHGGVRRGAVDVVVRYTTSLRAQGAIRRAGNDAVVEVSTVPWERGLEAAEVRLALPTSARRAQWIADDTPGVDATTTTELSRDVVHALRRHLPAGARWTARIATDPSVFPWLSRGEVHAPQVIHRAPRPVRPALGAGLALMAALLLGARRLARETPPAAVHLPDRVKWLPGVLVPVGAALQAAALAGFPLGFTLGTLGLLVAIGLRMPGLQPLATVDPKGTARVVSSRDVAALSPPRARVGIAAGAMLVLAAALAVTGARIGALPGLLTGLGAVDLAVGAVALLAFWRSRKAPPDVAVLWPLARTVESQVNRTHPGHVRIAWRVRGNAMTTGSLRARLVARPGWRMARGVHAVEWAVAVYPGIFGWRPVAVALVRVDSGSMAERSLRALAVRAGSVRVSPDGDQLAYSVELVGLDGVTFRRALNGLVGELFVPAPRTTHGARYEDRAPDAGIGL